MKIAISGKGGVGKTTIAAGLVKYFANKGYQIIAVDADPDLSLGTVLGLPDAEINDIKPIVDMRELINQKTSGDGAFFSLNPEVEDILEDYSVNLNGIKFLKMGSVKQGGTSCYCRENSVLHALISSLLLQKEQMVFLDMGAGIEHLTRGTAKGVDLMLVITEPSRTSIQTARLVQKLAQEIGVNNVRFIGNKIHSENERKFLLNNLAPSDFLGFLNYNSDILAHSMELNSANLNKLAKLLNNIGQKIEQEVGENF